LKTDSESLPMTDAGSGFQTYVFFSFGEKKS